MSATPQAYNSTFRRALSITVIDLIREQHAAGMEVTNNTITTAIRERTKVTDKALRTRVANAVRDLELSGLVTRESRQTPTPERIPYKVITPQTVRP